MAGRGQRQGTGREFNHGGTRSFTEGIILILPRQGAKIAEDAKEDITFWCQSPVRCFFNFAIFKTETTRIKNNNPIKNNNALPPAE